jgi:soluble lytic murein transglycosylase
MWPRFPGLPGDSAVRMTSPSPVTAIAINGTVAAQSTTHAER